MKINTITVTAGRTFNHPHEDYSNLRPSVTMTRATGLIISQRNDSGNESSLKNTALMNMSCTTATSTKNLTSRR